jgi:hypothetical protein
MIAPSSPERERRAPDVADEEEGGAPLQPEHDRAELEDQGGRGEEGGPEDEVLVVRRAEKHVGHRTAEQNQHHEPEQREDERPHDPRPERAPRVGRDVRVLLVVVGLVVAAAEGAHDRARLRGQREDLRRERGEELEQGEAAHFGGPEVGGDDDHRRHLHEVSDKQ